MTAMSNSSAKRQAGNQRGNRCIILLEGFVKVARRTRRGQDTAKATERIIAYRQGGDYFAGGLDLLGDGRAVTVTAINRVSVAEVPRPDAARAFQHAIPKSANAFNARLQQYRRPRQPRKPAFFDPYSASTSGQPQHLQRCYSMPKRAPVYARWLAAAWSKGPRCW